MWDRQDSCIPSRFASRLSRATKVEDLRNAPMPSDGIPSALGAAAVAALLMTSLLAGLAGTAAAHACAVSKDTDAPECNGRECSSDLDAHVHYQHGPTTFDGLCDATVGNAGAMGSQSAPTDPMTPLRHPLGGVCWEVNAKTVNVGRCGGTLLP